MAKPLYNKLVNSSEFNNKADAEKWAKKQRQSYKGAEMSVKYDIARTPNGTWKAQLFVKT